MPTKQDEASAWISIYGRGLGIVLGLVGFIYELTIDHLSHSAIIPSLVILIGSGVLAEVTWKHVILSMTRSRLDITTPLFRIIIDPQSPAARPATAETVVTPLPREKSRTTPLPEEPPTPNSPETTTPDKSS